MSTKMRAFLRNMILVGISVGILGGCRHFTGSDSDGDRYPITRNTPPEIRVVEVDIPRSQLITALEKDLLTDRLRVIEMYSSQESSQPLYRLFDIDPSSVYALLGLKNADILVAANERYLRNAQVFKGYVRLLRNEKSAQIEIMRGNDPLLYKYNFVE